MDAAVHSRPLTVSAAPLARAGLANELFPIAKAYLAARALGVPLVAPAWGRDRRPYWRHFSRSRLDVANHALALAGRRRLAFTEEAYRASGVIDYGASVHAWFEAEDDASQRAVVMSEGMWGGFPAIDAARSFVRNYLAHSRYAAENVAALAARRRPGRLLAAVHVRGGDFAPPQTGAAYRRAWSISLPVEWYATICRGLLELLGDTVEFLVVGDVAVAPVRNLVSELRALTTVSERFTDVSDLLLLSTADVLVCSVSSYSLVAAWLGDAPYIWLREQLDQREGWLSLWGDDPAQQAGLTSANRHSLSAQPEMPVARGVPAPLSGILPQRVAEALAVRGAPWDRRADLLYYGVLRDSLEVG